MYKQDDKLKGVFVGKALSKQTGKSKGAIMPLLPSGTKIYSEYRHMDGKEIESDVTEYNTQVNLKGKGKMASIAEVVEEAWRIQGEILRQKAREEAERFRKKEKDRQEKMKITAKAETAVNSVKQKVEENLANKRLQEQKMTPGLEEEVKVKDMQID